MNQVEELPIGTQNVPLGGAAVMPVRYIGPRTMHLEVDPGTPLKQVQRLAEERAYKDSLDDETPINIRGVSIQEIKPKKVKYTVTIYGDRYYKNL